MSPVAPFQPRTRILSFLIAVIAGGFWSLPGLASESPGGFWVGSAFFDGGGDMPLRFKIEHRNQAWSATFFALLQDAEPLPVQEIEWTAPRLEMTRVTASGKQISFTGQVENSTITGRVDWAGSGADLELFRTPEPLAEIPSSSYADCAGVYRISPERSVIVAPRFWGELVYTDLGTGGNATLFPLTDSTFFAGPGMLIPGPVVVRASFNCD